ncbi:MAG: 7-cyano-7-deazaguanine synthase, partial [Flavobacteriaceae bacterium]
NISKIQLGIDKGSLFDKMFKDYGDDSRFTTFIKHFSFPIIHLSKQDMYNIAQENKWLDIMKLTWFCHKPKKNSPCGKCNPCKSVINEGMSWRIPKTRLLLRHF